MLKTLGFLIFFSFFHVCREHGWRGEIQCRPSFDPCAVCLERTCTVSAEGITFPEDCNLQLFSFFFPVF